MREHKSESNDRYQEVHEEEEEEAEMNNEEFEEEGEDIHEATADARTEAESELKYAGEGEPSLAVDHLATRLVKYPRIPIALAHMRPRPATTPHQRMLANLSVLGLVVVPVAIRNRIPTMIARCQPTKLAHCPLSLSPMCNAIE